MTSPTTPRVSLLVVSYDRAEVLRASLASIFATGWPELEVIVVDNADSDATAAVAGSFAGVNLIRSPKNLGFALGNDLALAHASGTYIALVNDDAVIAPDWIAALVAFLDAHPRAAAAGGREYFWSEHHPPFARTNPFHGPRVVKRNGEVPATTSDEPVREVATLPGMAVMIRRSAIEDAGAPFLDPLYFMYYEETDFFARVVRKGWRLFYVAAAECWHRTAGRKALSLRVEFQLEKNRVLFAWRHASEARVTAIERRLRRRALAASWQGPMRRMRGQHAKAEQAAARRDAWQWVCENRELLAAERERFAGLGPPFDRLAEEIQTRASVR